MTTLKPWLDIPIKPWNKISAPYAPFFDFFLETGEVQTDFASKTPMVQARKQTRIPSVWTKDELNKLIGAIDRGNPKGKRDYAIILLGLLLGSSVYRY